MNDNNYLERAIKMKQSLCLLLAFAVFFVGCAGTEGNPVRIHQIDDEQKTCEELRSEMFFIESEISRLLPKSDKTGRNIALGATGVIFIIPLFFIDLKQGEKKEVEAYQQRHNYLLMLSTQKDCKRTPVVTANKDSDIVSKTENAPAGDSPETNAMKEEIAKLRQELKEKTAAPVTH